MQQRTYHGAIEAEGLADYLIAHYSPIQGQPGTGAPLSRSGLNAQKIGKDGSFIVQVGHGKDPTAMHHIVVTVAIATIRDKESGVVVTVGQRTWVTQDELGTAAIWALLAALVTPFALFGLLWPLSQVLSDSTLPKDIWNSIDVYTASLGVSATDLQPLTHPHVGS